MLVLSRKLGETIELYQTHEDGTETHLCRIMLVNTQKGVARIGLDADPSIRIIRSELVKNESQIPSA